MSKKQEVELSIITWKKQTGLGVVDFRREFVFDGAIDSQAFVSELMEIEHKDSDAIIEITTIKPDSIVEVLISTSKEKAAKQLLRLVEDVYNKTKTTD